jgi:hypothetical protein
MPVPQSQFQSTQQSPVHLPEHSHVDRRPIPPPPLRAAEGATHPGGMTPCRLYIMPGTGASQPPEPRELPSWPSHGKGGRRRLSARHGDRIGLGKPHHRSTFTCSRALPMNRLSPDATRGNELGIVDTGRVYQLATGTAGWPVCLPPEEVSVCQPSRYDTILPCNIKVNPLLCS